LIIVVLGNLKEKIKMSEDDIKTIFFVLSVQHQGSVFRKELDELKDGVEDRLREFYRSRINR
jgi:hypothetical protein